MRARRLVSPADEYQAAFRPALRRALLAWRCAGVLLADPTAPIEAAVPQARAPAVQTGTGTGARAGVQTGERKLQSVDKDGWRVRALPAAPPRCGRQSDVEAGARGWGAC